MYLIDTDVISAQRKGVKANQNVQRFFAEADKSNHALDLSVVTVGELRRGVEIIRYRKDTQQAKRLETWLETLLSDTRIIFLSSATRRRRCGVACGFRTLRMHWTNRLPQRRSRMA